MMLRGWVDLAPAIHPLGSILFIWSLAFHRYVLSENHGTLLQNFTKINVPISISRDKAVPQQVSFLRSFLGYQSVLPISRN